MKTDNRSPEFFSFFIFPISFVPLITQTELKFLIVAKISLVLGSHMKLSSQLLCFLEQPHTWAG